MSKHQPPVYPDEPKIPILPNMLTAGNLLCGFFAILTIFEGMKFDNGTAEAFNYYQQATYLIFAACIFDLLDGRVARMCKADGPFGREFDSIADVVSFGIAPAMLLGALAGWLVGLISVEAGILAGGFTSTGGMIAVMALMLLGPANKHCANDNTSGVAAVMELMQRLPQEQRGKAAFILFDNEELGLLGSSAYASKHKAVKKDKLIINMDCVGDGENLLFFANKRTRELPCFPALESAMAEQRGRNFVMNQMEKCVYPSDQASFRHGIAVCACNRAKVIGYYCDKIHTKKDTICEQANLDFLAAGLADFTSRL